MKKLLGAVTALILLLSLTACGGGTVQSGGADALAGHPGYYTYTQDGIVTVTNYDPDALSDLPALQEVAEFGPGAGLDHPDEVVYCIYILDSQRSTQENEVYYYAELAEGTLEVLVEEDFYFQNEADRKAAVDKLVGMIDEVRS